VAYPDLMIHPLVHDFTRPFSLPPEAQGRPTLGFFPGSTLGNFQPEGAVEFLSGVRASLGGGHLLIGVDLVKDIPTMLAAYDDAEGVTAAFNKNLLVRINRELMGNIDLDAFVHRAVWNSDRSRIEMHLVCRRPISFSVGDKTFLMQKGETIHTENSHKFTVPEFMVLSGKAGWHMAQSWINDDPAYGLFLLKA
jgi:dimethylhistidine N-methyltransferase